MRNWASASVKQTLPHVLRQQRGLTPPRGTHAALQRIVDYSPLALVGLLDTGTLTTLLQTYLPARLGTKVMPLALPCFST